MNIQVSDQSPFTMTPRIIDEELKVWPEDR